MRHLALAILLLAVWAGVAQGVERFPPPEFDSGYQVPETETPGRQIEWWQGVPQYADVAVLVAAIALATVFALKRRSRLLLFITMLGSLAYLGFYRKGCVCPIGAIQNVTEGLFNPGVVVPIAVIAFFIVPLVTTLLFGRTFCGAVCPLGAVQDAALIRPVRVPRWVDHSLGLAAYLYLGAAVMFAATGTLYVICRYDPFVAIFRLVDLPKLSTTGTIHLLVLTGVFLAVGTVIGRPYCRWLCPYGALLRLLSRVSWRHVTITPADCVQCSLCEDACPYGAIRKPTAEWTHAPRSAGKVRLALLVVLVPVLAVAGGAIGWRLGGPMARIHRTVKLARLVRLEEAGEAKVGSTDETDAFWKTGRTPDELFADAQRVTERFAGAWKLYDVTLWTGTKKRIGLFVPGAAAWFGAFAGLVVGVKLAHVSLRRRRADYEPDRATCVSCGRCFEYCPVERDQAKKIRAAAGGGAKCPHDGLPPLAAGKPLTKEATGKPSPGGA